MKTVYKNCFQVIEATLYIIIVIFSGILYPQTGNRWTRIDSSILTLGYGKTLYNGDVLINQYPNGSSRNYQTYNFRTNTWKITGSVALPMIKPLFITLKNNAVLSSGIISLPSDKRSAEIYNPQTGEWILAGSTNYTYKYEGSLHLLPSGEVLLLGDARAVPKNVCEIFNPSTLTWQISDTLRFNRVVYSSVSLPDGRVLVVGAPVNGLKSFEVYNPVTRSWNYFPPPVYGTNYFQFLLTKQGRLFMFENGNNAEVFNFTTNSWEELNYSLQLGGKDQIFELDNNNVLRFTLTQYGWVEEIDINTGTVLRKDSIPFIPVPNRTTRLQLTDAQLHKMGNGKFILPGGRGIYFVQSDLYADMSRYSFIYTPDFIAGTAKETPKPEKTGISVYPNPFSSFTTIAYSLSQAENVKIEIYNTLGEKITAIDEGNKSAGEHKKEIGLPGTSAGIYFCRLIAGKETKTVKLLSQ